MNYEQKIMPEDGGYKGFLLANGEVISTTVWCKTLAEASVRTRRLQEEAGVTITPKTPANQEPTTEPEVNSQPVNQENSFTPIFKKPKTGGCCGRR